MYYGQLENRELVYTATSFMGLITRILMSRNVDESTCS